MCFQVQDLYFGPTFSSREAGCGEEAPRELSCRCSLLPAEGDGDVSSATAGCADCCKGEDRTCTACHKLLTSCVNRGISPGWDRPWRIPDQADSDVMLLPD